MPRRALGTDTLLTKSQYVPELNASLRCCHPVSHHILLLFTVPGVCSSVLRKDWKCTVPAAALGTRLLHLGKILLEFEKAKSREGNTRLSSMWFGFSLCESFI